MGDQLFLLLLLLASWLDFQHDLSGSVARLRPHKAQLCDSLLGRVKRHLQL